MSTERLAYNLSLYRGVVDQFDRREILSMAAHDLASLSNETAQKITERIYFYEYRQTDDGRLYCPDYPKLPDDPVTRGLQERIRTDKEPFLYFWFSPADLARGWPEGRIVAGFANYCSGRYRVENYGFCPQPNFSSEECLILANQILQLSHSGTKPIENVEELREKPLFLNRPANLSFVQLAKELVPMSKIWQEVESGRAKKRTQRTIEAAKKTIGLTESVIFENGDHILAGALVESMMVKEMRRPMRGGSGCGALNSEITGKLVFGKSDSEGTKIGQKMERKTVFCKECPICGVQINKVISAGYVCVCGNIYQGVC